MKIKKYAANTVLLVSICSFLLAGCGKTDNSGDQHGDTPYPFLLTGTSENSESTYIIPTHNLLSDIAVSEKHQINISKKWANEQWIISKGTAFFNIDPDKKKFQKLEFDNKSLHTTGEMPFTLFTRMTWYQWLAGDTLLIGGNGIKSATMEYAQIDTKGMKLIRSGTFPVPAPPVNMEIYSCSGTIRDDKFYLGYSVIDPAGSGSGKYANDTAYLATMDYPSLANIAITKDTRSTFPGSGRAGNGGSFLYNGDIYILTSPVDWNGQNTNKPTGFLRIKKGEDTFDKDYFFNVSALLNNDDPDALIDLGDGKVIARSCQHENVRQWSDWSKEITQYVVFDVVKQTAKILDLPPFVVSPGGVAVGAKAYLPVQTQKDGIAIYEYDADLDTLTKGMKVQGLHKFGKIYKVR